MIYYTYLLIGLAVTVTNVLILTAIRAPQGGSRWVLPASLPVYVIIWPLLLLMWAYRAWRPMPQMDTRRIPKTGEVEQ